MALPAPRPIGGRVGTRAGQWESLLLTPGWKMHVVHHKCHRGLWLQQKINSINIDFLHLPKITVLLLLSFLMLAWNERWKLSQLILLRQDEMQEIINKIQEEGNFFFFRFSGEETIFENSFLAISGWICMETAEPSARSSPIHWGREGTNFFWQILNNLL